MSILIDELKEETGGDLTILIDRLNKFQNSALMDSVTQGAYKTVELLIANHADLNRRNKIGNTAAHIAALNGRLSILQLLVEKRIDVLAKNFEDFTCFDHAQNMANQEAANFLEPVVIKAEMWRNKNAIMKIFLNRLKLKNFKRIYKGMFREIIKYA